MVILAGKLLEQTEGLVPMELTPTEIAEGTYEKALEEAHDVLQSLVCQTVENVQDTAVINKALKSAIMAKQYGNS